MTAKRNKVEKYAGIYYRDVATLDGHGTERMYYITYRRGGRESPLIEEPVGRASEGWTPAKVNIERARRITGGQSNKERREAAEAEARNPEDPPTVERLWELFHEAMADRPKQQKDDEGRAFYLRPLMKKFVSDLQTRDIDALLRKLAKTRGRHNPDQLLSAQTQKHVLTLLKRMLNFAVRKGLCPFPAGLAITMPRVDNQKTENMTAEQMAAYWKALDSEPDQNVASILRIALLTGIRKNALLSLTWDDIDFERGVICLRGANAKSGKTSYVPLNSTARKVFESLKHGDGPLVWPSPKTGEKRKNIYHVADRVREKAGLPRDFRPLHGLRHTFASHLASSGEVDLYMLQKLLTHGSPLMTQRYAHLADEALRRASEVADGMVPSRSTEE